MTRKKPTIAIAYDFDGTLAHGNMQEHRFLPEIGLQPDKFWAEVKEAANHHQADEVLIYMNLMLKKAEAANRPIRKEDFVSYGRGMRYFPGVETWFDRINDYGKELKFNIEHYIISSGNAEIVEGTSIKKQFKKIYASKFIFNASGIAEWPALAINYTAKTQFLFRINKGIPDISDNHSVNEYVEKSQRPVPFEQMIFIGDGSTDIPCFRLVKDQGGLSIAVYPPSTPNAKSKAAQYLSQKRVHAVTAANYTQGNDLEVIVFSRIAQIRANLNLEEKMKFRIKNTKEI